MVHPSIRRLAVASVAAATLLACSASTARSSAGARSVDAGRVDTTALPIDGWPRGTLRLEVGGTLDLRDALGIAYRAGCAVASLDVADVDAHTGILRGRAPGTTYLYCRRAIDDAAAPDGDGGPGATVVRVEVVAAAGAPEADPSASSDARAPAARPAAHD